MLRMEKDGSNFYAYAMELYSCAGHISTLDPLFINHSSDRFVLFDCKENISLSTEQRELLNYFDNVSYLFRQHGCAFFSINLLTSKSYRSVMAHSIHTLIHLNNDANASVCLFLHDDKVMLSFIGYEYHCILSDWYPLEDDYDSLQNKLDIANISVDDDEEYFADLVFMLARDYYFQGQPSVYQIIPIDLFSRDPIEKIDKEEIDQIIQEALYEPQRLYGDDYVGYEETVINQNNRISDDIDLLLLEISDDEDIHDEIEENDSVDNDEEDIYEFEDYDPEIFRDPTLMVKWLNKNN